MTVGAGIRIDSNSGAGTFYGLYIDSQTGQTAIWTGDGDVRFGGDVEIEKASATLKLLGTGAGGTHYLIAEASDGDEHRIDFDHQNDEIDIILNSSLGIKMTYGSPMTTKVYGTLEIEGNLNHDGNSVGFYATTPAVQQDITGSRGSNAALASLLTALETIGLITDSTT